MRLSSLLPFAVIARNTEPPGPETIFLKQEVATPPSLMLHSHDQERVLSIIPALNEQEYSPITYRDYYKTLLHRPKNIIQKPILISLDDLPVHYLNPAFKRIITAFSDAGMRATLGIVTRYERRYASREIWDYYRKLAREGWELAIHTEDHPDLTTVSNSELIHQIEEPYGEILDETGIAPATLILPYGAIINKTTGKYDERIFEVAKSFSIRWIVGIADGKTFQGEPPYYVGRIAPLDSGTGAQTVKALEKSFPQLKQQGQ